MPQIYFGESGFGNDNYVNKLSDNLIEYRYLAEYQAEDGTITTEEISFFEIIE